jgi:hypothetical protein
MPALYSIGGVLIGACMMQTLASPGWAAGTALGAALTVLSAFLEYNKKG